MRTCQRPGSLGVSPVDASSRSADRPDLDPAFLRAVHLAAHAVTASVCGAPYSALRLEARTTTSCDFVPEPSAGGGPARNATEASIIATLAGSEAEALAAGAPRGDCCDVTRWLTDGDPAEAAPYIEWLRLKATRAIEHPLRQRLINRLALELLDRSALAPDEVVRMVEWEIGRYMRGQ